MNVIKTAISKLVFCFFLFFNTLGTLAQSDSVSANLSFDLGLTRGRNYNLWPIFKKYKSQDRSELQILYPIFSKNIDYKQQIKHVHLLPFAISDSNSSSIDKRFLSLYYPSGFHYQAQNAFGDNLKTYKFLEVAPNISILGLSKSANGLFVDNNLLFFVWYKRDPFLNKTKFVVFPSYWYFSNKKDTTQLCIPLWYNYKNAFERKLNVALLYNSKKTSSYSKKCLFPIWWHRAYYSSADTTRKNVIFPVYWSTSSKAQNNQIIFPLVYKTNSYDYKSLTVLPFFSVGNSPSKTRSHLDIIPVYWHYKDGVSLSTVVFPLWWQNETYYRRDTTYQKVAFPIYWSLHGETDSYKIIAPIYYKIKNYENESLTIFPFWYCRKSLKYNDKLMAITPLYWQFNSQSYNRNTLFPIYWQKKLYLKHDTLTNTTVFPLYWAKKSKREDTKIVLPLVYSIKKLDYQSLTIVPFYSAGHSPSSSRNHRYIIPIYWHFRTKDSLTNILFPLWWSTKIFFKTDTVSNQTLFPLYWSVKSKEKNNKIVIPFIVSLKDKNYQSFTLLPLFSVGHSTDYSKTHFNLFPAYWRSQTSTSSHTALFPLWWSSAYYSKNDTLKKKTLFPIYWSASSKLSNYNVALPIFFKFRNQERESTTIFPLISYGHNTQFKYSYLTLTPLFWHVKKPSIERNILFPLVWNKTEYYKLDTFKRNVIFPLYWASKNSYENNHILLPFVYRFKNNNYQSITIFPLFSEGHNPDLTDRHLYITPLYWHTKTGKDCSDVLFPIWWKSREHYFGDTICKQTLFPIYWAQQSNNLSYNVLFPLVFKSKDRSQKRFTLFPFFSIGRSMDSTSRYLAITPFYWNIKEYNLKRNIVFPLFWNNTQYINNDTITKNTLFPIYWARISKDKDIKFLAPLVLSIKKTNYQSFTIIPVFSIGHSPDRTHKQIFITPFAAYIQGKTNRKLYAFPLFYHYSSIFETRSSVLIFAYRHTSKTNYSKTSILWPICERLKTDKLSSFRIAPLVWYSKTDTSKMFSIQPIHYWYESQTQKKLLFLWFVYRYENKINTSVSNSILWKVYNNERYTNGDFETRFLYLGYANIHKDGRTEKSIFPFYHNVSYPNGDKSKSVFFSFYNHFRQYIPEINEAYEEERIFWFMRIRSNYAKLKSEGKERFLKRK